MFLNLLNNQEHFKMENNCTTVNSARTAVFRFEVFLTSICTGTVVITWMEKGNGTELELLINHPNHNL